MDIKRGLLWFVLLFSLLTLWNNWNVYNGKAPLFGAKPPAEASLPNAPAAASAGATAAGTPAGAAASATATAAPVDAFKAEDVVVTTDVFKATFDTAGAKLKRLELLQYQETKAEWLGDVVMDKFRGTNDKAPPKNVVIFDNTPESTYLAETGLTGAGLPGIDSGYTVRPGARALDNGDTLQLVFDAEKNGVKLTKTFTFKRGQYAIAVKHEVTNNTAAAIAPTLDMRLVRDGTLPKNPRFAPNPMRNIFRSRPSSRSRTARTRWPSNPITVGSLWSSTSSSRPTCRPRMCPGKTIRKKSATTCTPWAAPCTSPALRPMPAPRSTSRSTAARRK